MQPSSANFVDGRLLIEVTGSDSVQVLASHGQAMVKFNGETGFFGAVDANEVTEIFVTADAQSSGHNRIDLSRVNRARFSQLTGTTVLGGAGNDTIIGSQLNDELDGANGNDRLLGRRGADTLFGGEGRDRLWGDEGIDCLEGESGRDTLRGGAGQDKLIGDIQGDMIRDFSWQHVTAPTLRKAHDFPSTAMDDAGEDAGDGSSGPSDPSFFAATLLPLTVSIAPEPSGTVDEVGPYATFRVSLSAMPTSTVTVDFMTSSGSATDGSDYSMTSGTLTFEPTDPNPWQDVTVPIYDDVDVEGNETFSMGLLSPSPGLDIASGAGTASMTIIDNDFGGMTSGSGSGSGTPTVSISDGWGQEGSGGGVGFWVSLSFSVPTDVTVYFTSADGMGPNGATSPADYLIPGSLTIPAYQSGEYLQFPIVDDAIVESSETFTVTLTGATGADTVSGSNSATGTIADNEPTLDIDDGGGIEGSGSGGGSAWFTINLNPAPSVNITVNWTVSFASSGPLFADAADFPSLTGSEVVLANTPTWSIPIPLVDDGLVENSEGFTVTVSAVGTNPGDVTADGTIYDNEPEVSIGAGSGTEWTSGYGSGSGSGLGYVKFPVTLSHASPWPITVTFSTGTDSTVATALQATAGSDCVAPVAPFNTITFNPGDTNAEIWIPIVDDAVVEVTEYFRVTLTSATAATLAASPGDNAQGTIYDNEPEISIADGSGREWTSGYGSGSGSGFGSECGIGEVRLRVSLSHSVANTVTVNYATSVDTTQPVENQASASDYGPTGTTGTVTFNVGETSKYILIPIVDDALVEEDEKFKVSLTGANGAKLPLAPGADTVIALIHDNEPDVSIDDAIGTEGSGSGAGTADFTVTLSHTSNNTITVDYSVLTTSGDTAISPDDYNALTGTLTFSPGVLTQTIQVTLTNDDEHEDTETYAGELTSATGARLGVGVSGGKGVIYDDDSSSGSGSGCSCSGSGTGQVVSITDAGDSVEGGVLGSFRVSRTNTIGSLSVGIQILYRGDPSEATPADYALSIAGTPITLGSGTFNDGQSDVYIDVEALVDGITEGLERLVLELLCPPPGPPPAYNLDNAVAMVLLADDGTDTPTWVIEKPGTDDSIYIARNNGATLSLLATMIPGGVADDWTVIWPIADNPEDKARWDGYPNARKGARADVDNLLAPMTPNGLTVTDGKTVVMKQVGMPPDSVPGVMRV